MSVIENILERADIVQLADHLLGASTGGSGSERHYNCNRHRSQSKQSFHVNTERPIFQCLGCQKGGDLIDMVAFIKYGDTMKYLDRGSKSEVIKWMCNFYDIEEEISDDQKQARADRVRVYDLLTEQCEEWHQALLHRPEVIDWVKEQWGFTDEQISKAMIGYSESGKADPKYAETGSNNGRYTFFNNRVMFPYFEKGRAIYAIGRKTPWTPDNQYESGKYKKLPTYGEKMQHISRHIRNDHTYNSDSINSSNRVIITEGIADCAHLMVRGIASCSPVTTSFKGSLFDQMAKRLQGKEVIIINDMDDAGQSGAIKTADYLYDKGVNVKIGKLPMRDGVKSDVAEYFRSGGTADGITAICDTARPYLDVMISRLDLNPSPADCSIVGKALNRLNPIEQDRAVEKLMTQLNIKKDSTIKKMFKLIDGIEIADSSNPRRAFNPIRDTETGNAERFAELNLNRARYIKNQGWYIWDGKRWLADESAALELYRTTVIPKLYEEAIGERELAKWAKKSESLSNINNSLSLAATMPGIYIRSAELMDANPWLINCENGTLDLRTGSIKPHL